jgi:hypothetical protein
MDGKIDVNAVQKILKDHFDHPFSVCAHASDDFNPAVQSSKTCLSIIIDLSQKSIWYTKGNPCQNPAESLDLTSFFD